MDGLNQCNDKVKFVGRKIKEGREEEKEGDGEGGSSLNTS